MTKALKQIWNRINSTLTYFNAILLALVTGNVSNPKEIKKMRIPVIANVFLLIFLGLGLVAAIYKIRL